MARKKQTKKPEEENGVLGSTGVQDSSRNNPPVVLGVKKDLKEKEICYEWKEDPSTGLQDSSVKNGTVLEQSKDPETYTDDYKFSNSGFIWDDNVKLEPVYAFDASGELVQVGFKEIPSQSSTEFQKRAPTQNHDDPYVDSDDDEFDTPEKRQAFRAWLAPRLFMPDDYQPDESPAPESPDLLEKGTRSFSDPPDEDPQKRMEETSISTNKNKNQEEEEPAVMRPEVERNEPMEIKCVRCESQAENKRRAPKCGHYFCSECFRDYISKNLTKKELLGSVVCPADCSETLSDEEVFSCLDERDRFEWLMTKNQATTTHFRERSVNNKKAAVLFMRKLHEIA